jgi:diguanylate cyclase (GGDEF)-like protein
MILSSLYPLYLGILTLQKDLFSFFLKPYMRFLFFILVLFPINTAYSQEQKPEASSTENNISVALNIIAQADESYHQKHYLEAITQYKEAAQYLSGQDKTIRNQLGETYKKIAQSYKRVQDREKTAYFYEKTLEIYTSLDNKKLMARTLNTLAEAERYLENYIVALDYSNRSLALYKEVNDPEGEAKALMGAGIIHRHIGLYEKSFDYVYVAHQYYKKTNNALGIAKTANEMGLIYTRLKVFDQARSFYQQTVDLPEDQLEPKTLATATREIAVIALDAKDYESAKKMAEKAYEIYLNENDKSKASIVARIIGNIYRAQNDKTNSIAYYEKSLSFASEIGSKSYQIKTLIPLAKELIGIDTNRSIQLLKEALALSIEKDMKSHQLYSYNSLRKAEKSLGNYRNALNYAEMEIDISELLQKEKDDNELVLMKAKLHSKKIEMELDTLKESKKLNQFKLEKSKKDLELIEKEKQISELKLVKNRYASLVLASLLIICLCTVIYIYRRFIASNKHNKELNYLATRDPLTNCYNRRVLFDFINKDFENSNHSKEYSIILIDIDHFKLVNDTYGHSIGDKVLRNVAKILQTNVSNNDIVSRFGGEEFCIILPTSSQDEAIHTAETIRQKVANEDFDEVSITCSLGVTSIKFNAQSATELIDQADLALFKSKSRGRNQVTLWDKRFKE